MSTRRCLPAPLASSPDAMRRRSRCTSSPASVVPASTIFRPLYSGGLWLPVTATALPQPSSCAAKRSEEHTSELQSHRDLHSFPTRRSSDLERRSGEHHLQAVVLGRIVAARDRDRAAAAQLVRGE